MANVRTYPGSLHNHTQYSNARLRDCIIKEGDLLNYAVELGHEVVAITDHESVMNAVKVEKAYKKIKEKNPDFKVIFGNEIYLCRNGLNNENFVGGQDRYYHFILLAKDAIGHQQIREISTRAWMRSYMARGMRRVPTYYQDLIDIIRANPGHVVGATACLGGALATQLMKYKETKSKELYGKIIQWCEQMEWIFGADNFYLELQPSASQEQTYVNRMLIDIANNFHYRYIITTDSHYLKKEDKTIHKAYLNAQDGDREVDSFYATTYMMDTEELESHLDLTPGELEEAYSNIRRIAAMCEDYSLQKPLRIPELKWKDSTVWVNMTEWCEAIPMFKEFLNSPHEADRKLVFAILKGIEEHPDLQNQRAYDEINMNLEMTWVSSNVNNARWSAYYLNLQKIIDTCWDAGSIVGPGRGSGVGFILLYVLGITQINPLRETTKCFAWRFLNPERVSVLDVDFDIEGGRRADVLNAFRREYGSDRVANVATFRTEKSKSAILTAARGLGIDVDIAQYIASLIPADRGQLRTLDQCMYGDEQNDWPPIKQFVFEMTENYPELWEVAHKVEGLVCGTGIHAGGVIFVDSPFTDSTALMRAPDGTICTQFDLHDCEDCSLIKYDALSVEAMDKIHNCLDLLCDYGYIERKETLKETYESVLGIYNLERTDPKMWEMVWNHEIQALFQMEKQSGIQGIATLKPTSVDDLAILNSTIRLMAQEKGGEMPTDKLARFKNDHREWDRELEMWGLGRKEKEILEPVLGMSYGLCIAQEQFMELVQLPELGGFTLTWADKLRKSIAKKNPADYDKLTKEFYEETEKKGINQQFAHYVWDVLIAMSKGYGFNQSHTLAYSLIGLQEMNLAYRFPIMFWNCACLISDAGGNEEDESDNGGIEETGMGGTDGGTAYGMAEDFVDFGNEGSEDDDDAGEDDEEDADSESTESSGKSKKKVKTTNYGKIATAIGKIKQSGVDVAPPDINRSTYTFSPDVDNNTIRYGLSGITKVGEELVRTIMDGRPYTSLEDFLKRIKINKPQMVNLIKSGAFDCFGDRVQVMREYIDSVSDTKKRITLQNMKMLIDFGLIPDEYDMVCRVYNFTKYLKKMKLNATYYGLDNIAFEFYSSHFDIDKLELCGECESGLKIKQTTWDNIYQRYMDTIRPWVKNHAAELLVAVNNRLTEDIWTKYCTGSLSKWEMDSVSFYSHEHELKNVDLGFYEFSDFFDLPEEPEIDRVIPIKGKHVPILRLHRIIGTVLDRDKAKKTVTLLTTRGVVTVKIFGGVFAQYDKQISERGADGKKHVIEKSMFSRGNKIIVCGVRDGDSFRAKKYSKTPWHLVEQITSVDEYGMITTHARGEE